eukprot:g8395.t1
MEIDDVKKRLKAIKFCQTSEHAVTICIWPSAANETIIQYVKKCLENDIGADIIYETKLYLEPHTSALIMMAVYENEEWLESNCWYNEQPLKDGKPSGAWPGAKWKGKLCFQEDQPLHIYVADVSNAKKSIWDAKYYLRSELSKRSGYFGNSCMHVSDDQSTIIAARKQEGVTNDRQSIISHGFSCDDSYAYHCCRIFLNPLVANYLNVECKQLNLDETNFMEKYKFLQFLEWLKDENVQDYDAVKGKFIFFN